MKVPDSIRRLDRNIVNFLIGHNYVQIALPVSIAIGHLAHAKYAFRILSKDTARKEIAKQELKLLKISTQKKSRKSTLLYARNFCHYAFFRHPIRRPKGAWTAPDSRFFFSVFTKKTSM